MRQFTHSETTHLTRYWCRTLGIRDEDLTRHPQIDDVIILIKFINEFEQDFKARHRLQIYMMWDSCYKNRRPLGNHDLEQLLGIGKRMQYVRQQKAATKQQARNKIKALRTLT